MTTIEYLMFLAGQVCFAVVLIAIYWVLASLWCWWVDRRVLWREAIARAREIDADRSAGQSRPPWCFAGYSWFSGASGIDTCTGEIVEPFRRPREENEERKA